MGVGGCRGNAGRAVWCGCGVMMKNRSAKGVRTSECDRRDKDGLGGGRCILDVCVCVCVWCRVDTCRERVRLSAICMRSTTNRPVAECLFSRFPAQSRSDTIPETRKHDLRDHQPCVNWQGNSGSLCTRRPTVWCMFWRRPSVGRSGPQQAVEASLTS